MRHVSLDEAVEVVSSWAARAQCQQAEVVPLCEACGRVIAQDVIADVDYPGFDNSAVDGYVIATEGDAQVGSELKVIGTIAAGTPPIDAPGQGNTYRILTGAPVPRGSYGIVMQEDVQTLAEGKIRVNGLVRSGEHVRYRGTDFRVGDRLILEGTRLNPGHLGVLATLGIVSPAVRRRPTVAVLTTGDEIVAPDEQLVPGRVRDSNGAMLAALVKSFGGELTWVRHIRDDAESLDAAIRDALGEASLVVITGGASVGDRDYAADVVRRHADVLFHGVRLKPGKPTLFASAGDQAILGLPGNPGAAFVGAHLYLRQMIARLKRERYEQRWITVSLMNSHKTKDRDELLRAKLDWTSSPPQARTEFEQGSFALTSLAECDCLVRIPARTESKPGDLHRALLLDDR